MIKTFMRKLIYLTLVIASYNCSGKNEKFMIDVISETGESCRFKLVNLHNAGWKIFDLY